MTSKRITVCICTFKRPALLSRTLTKVAVQKLPSDTHLTIVVVDNDAECSAESVCTVFRAESSINIEYFHEPKRGFASARNCALDHSSGDFVAFIDDDEVPASEWLLNHLQTLANCRADGVLGPVNPYFDEAAPHWLLRSRLCERPSYPTGTVLNWEQTRTGNALMKRDIIAEGFRFNSTFDLGGEDVDFFKRAMNKGLRFVWCAEAPVYELVTPERLVRGYYLRRALLQGAISLGYSRRSKYFGILPTMLKSCLAIGTYTGLIPLFWLIRSGNGMRLAVKNCHHIGRVLAACGLRPVGSRP